MFSVHTSILTNFAKLNIKLDHVRCKSLQKSVRGAMGETGLICDTRPRCLVTNVRGQDGLTNVRGLVATDVLGTVLEWGPSVGMIETVDSSLVTNVRGPDVTNVRGTWPSQVPGLAKPGSGTGGSCLSVLRIAASS